MTLTDRLGYAKFLYNVGKEYGEIFRGSVTGGAALTVVAKYLGLGTVGSIALGLLLVPMFLTIAVIAGYGVVRWRVIHATIEREWENNPYMRTQIDTLREIRTTLEQIKQDQGDSVLLLDGRVPLGWAMLLRDLREGKVRFSNGYEERAHQEAGR